VLRLGQSSADRQEDNASTGVVAGHCTRSYALTAARELSDAASDANDPDRHREYSYLRSEPAARSATAKPRTADSELDVQGLCFQLCHIRKKGAADKLAASLGKKYRVKLSTNDLLALVQPSALGGATNNTCMDMLHVADIGVTPKLAKCELALIFRSYALEVDGYKRDRTSVKRLYEERLVTVPRMPGLRNFKFGWWAARSGISAGCEWADLFAQLIVCFLGDENLLPDLETRERLTLLHCDYFSIYKRMYSRDWLSDDDIKVFDAALLKMVADFKWLQLRLDAPVPESHSQKNTAEAEDGNSYKNGMDIPKVMDMGSAAWSRLYRGCAEGTGTGPFEMMNKPLKKVVNATPRQQVEGLEQKVLSLSIRDQRANAVWLEGRNPGHRRDDDDAADDAAAADAADDDDDDDDVEEEEEEEEEEQEEATNVDSSQFFPGKRCVLSDSAFWLDNSEVLASGTFGPALAEHACRNLRNEARDFITGLPPSSFPCPCRTFIMKYPLEDTGFLLSPANCVLLYDGRFAQILLAVVSGKRQRPSAHFVVTILAPPHPGALQHPEAPFHWFARRRDQPIVSELIAAEEIEARVHVVPLHGRAGISPDDSRDYFFHLPGRWLQKRRQRDIQRKDVHRRCPFCYVEQRGRAERPPSSTETRPWVECDKCRAKFRF
jgi:hypothetical protein